MEKTPPVTHYQAPKRFEPSREVGYFFQKKKENHLPLQVPKSPPEAQNPKTSAPAIAAGTAATMTGSVTAVSFSLSPSLAELSRPGASGFGLVGWFSDGFRLGGSEAELRSVG